MFSDPPCTLYDGNHYVASQSVGHQLFKLLALVRREVEVRMVEHGLTDAQWKPLLMLKNGRAATAIELAREMCVDAGAVTRLVDRLQNKGLVERVRSASDRRVVHLRLTAEGEAAVIEVPHVLAAVNNDFLRGFSEDEWTQLQSLIKRMADNGQALQAERAAACTD